MSWQCNVGARVGLSVPGNYGAGIDSAANASSAVLDPGASCDRAAAFATCWSSALTGVGNPVSRPSRTISPVR